MDLSQPLKPPSGTAVAVAVGLVVSTVLYVVACLVSGGYQLAFFAIPVFVGIAAGALDPRRPFRSSLIALALALLLAILTFWEGVICVLFALPVLVPMLFLGAFVGSVFVARIKNPRVRGGSLGLLLCVGIGWQVWDGVSDEPLSHPLHVAESARVIDAPPAAVFAALTAKNVAITSRWPWFISIGLPMPRQMTMERSGLGGRMRFEFAHGTAFARITSWEPSRRLGYDVNRYVIDDLPFHITRLGRSPDFGLRRERVEDWLTVLDTTYALSPTSDGGTVLRRRVVWRRHLAPDLYFGWLQQTVIEHGQVRLLELLAERLETAPAKGQGETIADLRASAAPR